MDYIYTAVITGCNYIAIVAIRLYSHVRIPHACVGELAICKLSAAADQICIVMVQSQGKYHVVNKLVYLYSKHNEGRLFSRATNFADYCIR